MYRKNNENSGIDIEIETEIEEIILGCLVQESQTINIVLSYGIKEEMFSIKRHQIIFKTIMDLFSRQIPIDIISVTKYLSDIKKLDEVGGAYYIAHISSKVANAHNIEYYSILLVEKKLRRDLLLLSDRIRRMINEGEETFNVIEEIYNNILNFTNKINKRKEKKIYDAGKEFLIGKINGEKINEVTSGFNTLDNIIGGFRAGDLIILAGRPSMGKTSFALSSAMNIANKNHPCVMFSLEMSMEQLVAKFISILTHIPANKILRKKLSDSEVFSILEVSEKIKDMKFFIDDTPSISLNEIRAKCKRLKMSEDIKVIFVDYLQLINPGEQNKNSTREQEISKISRTLKSIAKELDLCVVALSQLNRNLERREDKEPRLSDLRESGAIEQDADMVIFIHRPEYYKINEDEEIGNTENMAKIMVAKNRNGSIGEIWMRFEKNITRFYDYDDYDYDNDNKIK